MESDASNPAKRETVPLWGYYSDVDLTYGRIFPHKIAALGNLE
jgi:hypothetical protein